MKEHHSLSAMLEARSVAIVGASRRPGSAGEIMVSELRVAGFEGPIYPVNPGYDEVLGLPCYPSLADLPSSVDLVILGVKNSLLESQLESAGQNGARAAVIFASCVEDPPQQPTLAQRLTTIADRYSMSLCGGSCMGFLNLDANLRALAYPERDDLRPGPITWLSHSGSVFTALLHNRRGLDFNLAVSSGMELTTSVADYLRYSLGLESTRLVAMFLETVRDPKGFREGLRMASERDIPVVVLKIGREEKASELVVAHSGALAGADGAYEALFREYGVIRVETLDEMADTLELLKGGRRAGRGGLAAIHDSGGERAHLIDIAAAVDTPLAEISDETKKRMAAVLDPGLPAVNPVDAWGTGHNADQIFLECMRALLADEDTAGLAFVMDLADELLEESSETAELAAEVFGEFEKPIAVMSNFASSIPPHIARAIRAAGIPLLEGTATGLRAFGHLFSRTTYRALPARRRTQKIAEDTRRRWVSRFDSDRAWTEFESLELLRDYGVPTARSEIATDVQSALEIANRFGWPVVVKTAAAISHKSDHGGVVVGVDDASSMERVFDDLSTRFEAGVLVQEMGPKGIELALGIVNDQQLGPLVMVAAGGVWIELFEDRAFALPPLDKARAQHLLSELVISKIFGGFRGGPPADVGAIGKALVSLSVLASDLGDRMAGLDVNPLIASANGCVAVDALVVPQSSSTNRPASSSS